MTFLLAHTAWRDDSQIQITQDTLRPSSDRLLQLYHTHAWVMQADWPRDKQTKDCAYLGDMTKDLQLGGGWGCGKTPPAQTKNYANLDDAVKDLQIGQSFVHSTRPHPAPSTTAP